MKTIDWKNKTYWTDPNLISFSPEHAGSNNTLATRILNVSSWSHYYQNLKEGFDLKFALKLSLTFARPFSWFQWWRVTSLDWELILIQFLQLKSYPIRDSLYQIQLQNWIRKIKKRSTPYFSHKNKKNQIWCRKTGRTIQLFAYLRNPLNQRTKYVSTK